MRHLHGGRLLSIHPWRDGETESAENCLRAFLGLDLARWMAWPGDDAEAVAAEPELLTAAERFAGADPLLDLTAAVRQGLRAEPETAEQRLAALPEDYPARSAWLHWRDLVLATGRRELWDPARRALAQQVRTHRIALIEAAPVLHGWIDPAAWRQETELLTDAAARLEAAAEAPSLASYGEARSEAGRLLVLLGADAAGARLGPESAVWLRRAFEQACAANGDVRGDLLRSTLGALFAVAARQRLLHLLVETLEPRPPRFDEPDTEALVLCEGSRAWQRCGDEDRAEQWFRHGVRLAARFATYPRSGEAGRTALRCHALGQAGPLEPIYELANRLLRQGDPSLSAEIAGRTRVTDDEHAWGRLTDAYRRARMLPDEVRTATLAACAATLLKWGNDAAGLGILRQMVTPETLLPTAALRDPPINADTAA
ncbi:MAG: hypothetical protein HYU66_24250, partial [Armatimonadetes bacterium]|nr:hypothetical protein [Armatimonadota bacterium]